MESEKNLDLLPMELRFDKLFSASPLETALSALVARLNDQLAHLQTVDKLTKSKVDRSEFNFSLLNFQNRVASIEASIHEFQRQISLPPSSLNNQFREPKTTSTSGEKKNVRKIDNQASIGTLVARVCERLEKLERECTRLASIERVERMTEMTTARVIDLENKVCLERASNKEMELVKNAQKSLKTQLTAVQELLQTKMDRVELGNLEDMVDKVEHFSKFHDQLQRELRATQDRLKVEEENRRQADAKLHAIQERLKALELHSKQTAPLRDLESIANLVVSMQETMERSASKDDLLIVSDKLTNLSSRLQHLASALTSVQSAQHDLESVTSKQSQQVDSSLGALATQRSLEALQSSMQDRMVQVEAKLKAMRDLENWVRRTDVQQMTLEKKVDLALRFMEWFSTRGEALEHNFHVVEDNLAKLSSQSLWKFKSEPFHNQQ